MAITEHADQRSCGEIAEQADRQGERHSAAAGLQSLGQRFDEDAEAVYKECRRAHRHADGAREYDQTTI